MITSLPTSWHRFGMLFRQSYLGCLAQASYLIGSDDEVAVVDPRRDVDEYITAAVQNGLTIRHVIETHLHADFVDAHRALAERTGAAIVIAAEAWVAAGLPTEGAEVRATAAAAPVTPLRAPDRA